MTTLRRWVVVVFAIAALAGASAGARSSATALWGLDVATDALHLYGQHGQQAVGRATVDPESRPSVPDWPVADPALVGASDAVCTAIQISVLGAGFGVCATVTPRTYPIRAPPAIA